MLRVKVQSCKWECLLCKRTFNSKFCYLLHCKNVHGKAEGKHLDEAATRPKTKFVAAKNRPRGRRYATRSSDRICQVCRKTFTNEERLLKHAKLHGKKGKESSKDEENSSTVDQDELSLAPAVAEETDKTDTAGGEKSNPKEAGSDACNPTPGKKRGRPKGRRNGEKTKTDENVTSGTGTKVVRKRGRPRKHDVTEKANTDPENIVSDDVVPASTLESTEEHKDDRPCEVVPAKKPRGQKRLTRECSLCNKVFASRSSLRAHNRIHTGEKPYTCSVCEKGFIRMGHLKQHMCSHTGIWPFKCGACGKGFMNPSRVTRHMRVHSDERPFVCDACGEGFKEPHHLTRHFFLHTGEKPFKCPICEDRYFIQPGNLKIHMKTHEKEIVDASLVVSDVSHEVVASDEANPEEKNDLEQQSALVGLASISARQNETVETNPASASENLENEHGYSGKRPEFPINSAEESITTEDKNSPKNEILLQIMPTAMNIQGFQDLSSIDQELLRHFATSVAHELVNSQ